MANPVLYIVSITPLPLARLPQDMSADPSIQNPLSTEGRSRNDGLPAGAPAPQNAWLFQSNPVLYDLRGALRTLKEQVWSVSRYAKEIKTGDRVYLWEAGREGGVAGVAEIAEPARLQPEPAEQLPFARISNAFAGERLRARLRVLAAIDPVIPRRSIVATAELSTLGVLRCSRGTNFRLSLEQWQALNDMVLGSALETSVKADS